MEKDYQGAWELVGAILPKKKSKNAHLTNLTFVAPRVESIIESESILSKDSISPLMQSLPY